MISPFSQAMDPVNTLLYWFLIVVSHQRRFSLSSHKELLHLFSSFRFCSHIFYPYSPFFLMKFRACFFYRDIKTVLRFSNGHLFYISCFWYYSHSKACSFCLILMEFFLYISLNEHQTATTYTQELLQQIVIPEQFCNVCQSISESYPS